MEPIDITKMDLKELKAMAYDEIAKIELCQNNLKMLNAEIEKRNEKANSEQP